MNQVNAILICRTIFLIVALTIPLKTIQPAARYFTIKNSRSFKNTTNDCQDQEKKLLTEDVALEIRKLAFEIKNENSQGIDYLKESGTYLYIRIPSPKELVDNMRQLSKEGEMDKKSFRKYEEWLKSLPKDERTKGKNEPVGVGFEPSTALPKPYGLKTEEGQTINLSENFLERFQILTEYDLLRIIRNSSIILSNFSGPLDQDIIGNHQQRLLQVFNSDEDLATPLSRVSAIFKFTASLIIIDTLLPPNDIVLTTDEYYVASLIIGTVYELF